MFLLITMMLALIALFVPSALGLAVRQTSNAPSVTVQNGTINGLFQPTYNQDLFLGIPFVQAPVGDLRLRLPQPIDTSWSEPLEATQYFPECVGYGVRPVALFPETHTHIV